MLFGLSDGNSELHQYFYIQVIKGYELNSIQVKSSNNKESKQIS